MPDNGSSPKSTQHQWKVWLCHLCGWLWLIAVPGRRLAANPLILVLYVVVLNKIGDLRMDMVVSQVHFIRSLFRGEWTTDSRKVHFRARIWKASSGTRTKTSCASGKSPKLK